MTNATVTSSPNDAVSKCVTTILEKLTFPAAKKGTTFSYPFTFAKRATPPANCDADALKEEGVNNVSLGQHAAALAKFEASLRCKFNSYVLQLAFAEACASGNSPKATVFYKQLSPAQQQKFAQMCIRTKTPYTVGSPPRIAMPTRSRTKASITSRSASTPRRLRSSKRRSRASRARTCSSSRLWKRVR